MNLKQFLQKYHKGLAKLLLSSVLCSTMFLSSTTVYADVDYEAEMESRKSLPIQSNEIIGWPEGPAIGAESAILMEMNTHTVLYAKNINEKKYMASTTKILTAIVVMSWLMLSSIRIYSLKFKNYSFKENSHRYILMIAAIVFVAIGGLMGMAITILYYVLSAVAMRFRAGLK